MSTCETKTASAVRQPAFTSSEDESGIHLQVALPGVKKEDLKLTVKDGLFRIDAARDNRVPEDWKTYAAQSDSVNYQLTARLSAKYDGANAKASLENGVLSLDIPVREEAKPREIFVN